MPYRRARLRLVVISTLLAGCQLVFDQLPRDVDAGLGGTPMDGGDGGGNVERRCVPSVPDLVVLGPGEAFTVDAAGKIGARLPILKNAIALHEDDAQVPNQPYPEVYSETGATFTTLALYAAGDSILAGRNGLGGFEIVRLVPESPGSWAPRALPTFLDEGSNGIILTLEDRVGAPTATMPRRMIVSRGERGFEEFLEIVQDRWQRVLRYEDQTLGSGMHDGNLSADGRLLAFVTKDVNGDQIMVAERELVTDTFSSAVVMHEDQGRSEAMPYITNDCKRIFYTGIELATGTRVTAVAKYQ